MAHLEVEPKRSKPWWVWLIVVIVLLALAAFLYKQYGNENTTQQATGADSANVTNATTTPNWRSVDFYTAETPNDDISDTDIATRGNDDYKIFTLSENILFSGSGNDISANGEAKLKIISDVLNKRYEGAAVGVYGSTATVGQEKANEELGKQRAAAVKNWLAATGGIPASNISVRSLGESQPVASDETEENNQQSRNVSIVVFPKK